MVVLERVVIVDGGTKHPGRPSQHHGNLRRWAKGQRDNTSPPKTCRPAVASRPRPHLHERPHGVRLCDGYCRCAGGPLVQVVQRGLDGRVAGPPRVHRLAPAAHHGQQRVEQRARGGGKTACVWEQKEMTE